MDLDRPIFIVGIGRCGSTIFHRILCEHPRVSWLTSCADWNPAKPARNRWVMEMADWPLLGSLMRRVYPSECYRFWEHHCPGFRRPFRDLTQGDLTERSRIRVRDALGSIPSKKRPRLSMKITGWPRLGLLTSIFPEAKFIHIRRDGRSVANSFMNVPWWWGWRGPENWRWGQLPAHYKAEWESHDRSYVALAGIQWKIYMDAFEAAGKLVPQSQLLDVSYEDLCKDPSVVYARVLEFCGLSESAIFSRALEGFSLVDTGTKWRRHLSEAQQNILNEVLSQHLEKHGYPVNAD
ncbi:MAG: sulfotransferase [Verrucomicrobiales bacterium]|nr:sulfotransferase [Verrucomicrobiales bacterium]